MPNWCVRWCVNLICPEFVICQETLTQSLCLLELTSRCDIHVQVKREWAGLSRTACLWKSLHWYLNIIASVLMLQSTETLKYWTLLLRGTTLFFEFIKLNKCYFVQLLSTLLKNSQPENTRGSPSMFSLHSKCLAFYLLSMKHLQALKHSLFERKETNLTELTKLIPFILCLLLFLSLLYTSIHFFPACFPSLLNRELKCFCQTKIEAWEMWFTPVTKRMQSSF